MVVRKGLPKVATLWLECGSRLCTSNLGLIAGSSPMSAGLQPDEMMVFSSAFYFRHFLDFSPVHETDKAESLFDLTKTSILPN